MKYIIEGYEPQAFFRHFEELCAIPHGSSDEKAISDFLMRFAEERGLEAYQDEIWNVVIKRPGSKGCESLEPVILQGHLDMVCEKNEGTSHDFTQDGLKLAVKDGWLYAEGTTLGGDDGAAVAMMMALLEDESLICPPLECVFTVQEETGLAGARQINPDWIRGRHMINLDSEAEGIGTVSCAGGMLVRMKRLCRWEESGWTGVQLKLTGLAGGHSGADIHLERGNANKLIGRLLGALADEIPVRLVSLQGGNKDNAIPREASAEAAVPAAHSEEAQNLLRREADAITQELAQSEPGFHLELISCSPARMMDEEATRDILNLLAVAPNGVLSRNLQAGGFVISSTNLGVISTEEDGIHFTFSPRSSVSSEQEQTKRIFRRLADMTRCEIHIEGEYPGWSYAPTSRIREVFCESYRELTGKEPVCEAIHAGLECGLFSEKLPGLDAIAIGPNLQDIHTPQERMDLASCTRTLALVRRMLEKLAGQADANS